MHRTLKDNNLKVRALQGKRIERSFGFSLFSCPSLLMFNRLVKQMAEREGVTEQLKADNQTEWVAQMNSIRSRVVEILTDNLIFN